MVRSENRKVHSEAINSPVLLSKASFKTVPPGRILQRYSDEKKAIYWLNDLLRGPQISYPAHLFFIPLKF